MMELISPNDGLGLVLGLGNDYHYCQLIWLIMVNYGHES